MAAQSTLREFAAHYVRHQPAYRRLLLSSLAAYVIGSTYSSLNPREKPSKKATATESDATKAGATASGSAVSAEEPAEGKGGRRKKKGPRVEVSRFGYAA